MDNELFEKAPIPEAYFSLAMPVVLSMLVTLVYNMVDTYFIAHTGNTDMVAGVSLTAPVFTVMIALGDIFGLGGSSVISRLFGQHRFADGKRLSAFCFYAAIATGLLILVLGLAFRDPMLALLGATDDTWQYASDFYTLIIVGSPFIIVSMTPSNLLRTEGHAVQSMIGSVAGTAVNIVLNPCSSTDSAGVLRVRPVPPGSPTSAPTPISSGSRCVTAATCPSTRGPSSTARAGVWRSRPGRSGASSPSASPRRSRTSRRASASS